MAIFFSLQTSAIAFTILTTLFFFFVIFPSTSTKPTTSFSFQSTPPTHRSLLHSSQSTSTPSCSSIHQTHLHQRCTFSLLHCNGDSNGLFNYASFHFCTFSQNPSLSIPILSLILLLQFYFLIKTAQAHFSPVVSKLSTHLNLSPSMGAVTLLALGNGAPDVFASVAAVRGGHARTGLSAILSAGTFVSAFVVGFVSIYAAPFSVDPAPFVRDVFFYLVSAFGLFYVYLSAEIFLWQAVGFVGFYLFFVGFVFWMDVGVERRGGGSSSSSSIEEEAEMGLIGDIRKPGSNFSDSEFGEGDGDVKDDKDDWSFCGVLWKITRLWEVPVLTLLKLTIPSTAPSEWSRFYFSANIALCPLALLYSFNTFVPLNHPTVFLIPQTQFSLWSVTLCVSSTLGLIHYLFEKEPPETEQLVAILIAFAMSVFWISTVAGELLNCLAAVGTILNLPPAILGLTVLAWGNSVGDLVADVAVAKAGQPAMAMAGCFAGPMFNMLVGLGTALVIETAEVYPRVYELRFHVGIVVAFVFLFLSLMGSLLVVTWFRFRVPRFWGFCLVGLYVLFIAVSLVIAKFSG